jgi:hypothetical protein
MLKITGNRGDGKTTALLALASQDPSAYVFAPTWNMARDLQITAREIAPSLDGRRILSTSNPDRWRGLRGNAYIDELGMHDQETLNRLKFDFNIRAVTHS